MMLFELLFVVAIYAFHVWLVLYSIRAIMRWLVRHL